MLWPNMLSKQYLTIIFIYPTTLDSGSQCILWEVSRFVTSICIQHLVHYDSCAVCQDIFQKIQASIFVDYQFELANLMFFWCFYHLFNDSAPVKVFLYPYAKVWLILFVYARILHISNSWKSNAFKGPFLRKQQKLQIHKKHCSCWDSSPGFFGHNEGYQPLYDTNILLYDQTGPMCIMILDTWRQLFTKRVKGEIPNALYIS
eukprot:403350899